MVKFCQLIAIYRINMLDYRMLDSTDLRLLAALQENSLLTAYDLGEILHLSPSQSNRRKSRLESQGYIKGYVARLDPERLGLKVQAFLHVTMSTHSRESAQSFINLASIQPEIASVWTLTGESDYLLRVQCRDLKNLNNLIHEVLLRNEDVARVYSQIVMDQPKDDNRLPIEAV